MLLIKLILVILALYLLGILSIVPYLLIKGFFGVIENPDESDKAWMEDRRKHPVRLFVNLMILAVSWPCVVVWTIRKYDFFVDEVPHDH